MSSKVMINIFGPPTAGKSTIVELLQKRIDRLFTVDFDVVKRQIAYYDWKRDSRTAQDITYDTLVSAARAGLQIAVLLPKPKEQQDYERIAAVARGNDYRLINIELTAQEDVLVKRYQDRLLHIADPETKHRMKNLDEFTVYIRTPYFRPADTVTFDSSEKPPDAIFSEILELIQQT